MEPISAASLGLFRIVFGIAMLWQTFRIKDYMVIDLANVKYWVTYDFFHWVKMVSPEQMNILMWVLAASCVLVAIGLLYRVATLLIFLIWTYVLLVDIGHYNNHYYLLSLIAFLMLFLGADRWGSVRRLIQPQLPKVIARWNVTLIKLQIVLVYFYGAIAKMEVDWLTGWPMRIWLGQRSHFQVVGNYLDTDFAALFFSYGGLLFDLTIGFFLLSPKTKYWALIPLIAFHLTNHFFWQIGVFPWFMIGITLLFFDADWPAKFLARFNIGSKSWLEKPLASPRSTLLQRGVMLLFWGFLTFQIVFPFRQFLFPGNTSWHGQGHHFAWRMMLVDHSDAARIRVAIPGQGTVGYVKIDDYIMHRQYKRMCRMPRSMARFAQHLKSEVRNKTGISNAEIYVSMFRRLNGRPPQLLLDSTVNLASSPYPLMSPSPWIMPLKEGLEPSQEGM